MRELPSSSNAFNQEGRLNEFLSKEQRESQNALYLAALNGNATAIAAELSKGLCKPDYFRSHALELAVVSGSLECVKLLSEKSDLPVNGYAVISKAASFGQVDVLRFLVELDDIGCVVKRDALQTALVSSAVRGHVECLEYLIPVCQKFSKDRVFSKALVRACGSGQVKSVEMLLPLADPLFENAECIRQAMKEKHKDVLLKVLGFHSDKTKGEMVNAFSSDPKEKAELESYVMLAKNNVALGRKRESSL